MKRAVLLMLALSTGWSSQGLCRWQTWNEGDGLASNQVRSISEDRTGALWVGTYGGGVSRYDGVSWRNFTTADGLVSERVYATHVDRTGTLWVGTEFGVSRYDGTSWRTFTSADGLPSDAVVSIADDRTGALWFSTGYNGVTRYDGTTWRTFTKADGLADNLVYSILEDRTGVLWFATQGGVSRYDGVSWRTFTTTDGLGYNIVFSLLEDHNGALWFGTYIGGVTRYDGVSWRTFTTADGLASNTVTSVLEDHNGVLWFYTEAGLSRYDGVSWRTFTIADGLVGFPGKMLEDKSGALWFGATGGVSRYDGVGWRTVTSTDGLVSEDIYSMLVDKTGALWLAPLGPAVSRFDGASWRTFTTADGLADGAINSIYEDQSGALWFATSAGASRYDGVTWRTFTASDGLASNGVNSVLEDHTGALWFATDAGVSRYDGVSWRTFTTADGLGNNYTPRMLEDRDGALWFASIGYGVSRYDGSSWRTFTRADGLADNAIFSVLKDRTGALWFGTVGFGVSRWDGVSWRTFTTADGLAQNDVLSMFEDRSGAVWFGTQGGGVSKYDGETWLTLTTTDGLSQSVVYSIIEDRSGNLWFAPGITVHAPDRVAPGTGFLTRPPAVSANRLPSIAFLPKFEDEHIVFQYSLNNEPWSGWSPVNVWGSRALPDGMYRFRVRARDKYGNIEAQPDSLFFEVDATPPTPAIVYPPANAALRDSIGTRGTASDPRFSYYQLELRRQGATVWTPLTDSMRFVVTDGLLGGWNTRGVADGTYELRLSVADSLGLVGRTVIPAFVDNSFPYVSETTPATVTSASGGNIYTTNQELHLYFPPRAFDHDALVSISPAASSPDTLPSSAIRVLPGYDISWSAASLRKSATLAFSTAGKAPAPGTLAVYYSSDGVAWQRLGGTPDNGKVSLAFGAPGRYALFAETSAITGAGTLGGLAFTPRVFSPTGGFANAEVGISFTLARPAPVTVRVYSRSGRLVREVVEGDAMNAGANLVRWDGRDRNGGFVTDGLYLVTVEALGRTERKALAVVK